MIITVLKLNKFPGAALLSLALWISFPALALSADYPSPGKGCLATGCHAGIEPIREHDSDMAKDVYNLGLQMGDNNGCIVCHGGNPAEETDKDIAHAAHPDDPANVFITFPGAMAINEKTCGQCHQDHVYAARRSIMQTQAGIIQGAMWGWGAADGYLHKYGNYDIDDPDGPVPLFGTQTYKDYTKRLIKDFPDVFPDKLQMVPAADPETINDKPESAVLTYLRSECLRCHLGVKGREVRGDIRGMGCSACHIPYGNDGFYEGTDKAGIPYGEKGHLLVHSIQSSRKTKVTVNSNTYSGIPNETCSSCHNRGKRIGVSFQGLMEFPYGTPLDTKGNKQPKLHSKYYLYIQDDVHHNNKSREGNPEGGMLCQDCHSTTSMHGNGNITGTTLANVEIECTDCHGTASNYPWELPLGFGDEFGRKLDFNKPRGTAETPLPVTANYATKYQTRDGFILSARGNPLGNVVRDGPNVVVHSASGLDFIVPTLKYLADNNGWKNPGRAITAMVRVEKHQQKLECYACHSAWAPQCYGCHVKVDYSGGKSSPDWVTAGNTRLPGGHTAESNKNEAMPTQPGKVTEGRTYLRWENPVLGINGEGRVSPIIPGCQQIITVIGPQGKTLVNNKIWRTPAGMENGGPQGQRGIDMAPATPHTTSREARTCASCHASSKALGYGTHDGQYMNAYAEDVAIDLATAEGNILTDKAGVQFTSIPDLPMGLDQVVTRDNKQLQTVGHHWPLSGPLPEEMRDNMERTAICISCHVDLPDGTIALAALHEIGEALGLIPKTDIEHRILLGRIIKMTANMEVFGPMVGAALALIAGMVFYRMKKKSANSP